MTGEAAEKIPVAMRPGETHVPIPNTYPVLARGVKTRAADGTMLETAWESRWPPKIKEKNARTAMRGKDGSPCHG